MRLFKEFVFEYPDYIEFDDLNEIIVTKHTKEQCYRVWEMTSYALHIVITDPGVQDIRVCKGQLVLLGMLDSKVRVAFLDLGLKKV